MIEIKRVQDGKVVMRFETETLAGGRFVNTDFSGTDLSGMDFSGADLRNCNLNPSAAESHAVKQSPKSY